MPNQYEQVGNGVSHLGQVAQNIALGLAQQRYQQQQLQAQMQLKMREQQMNEQLARQRAALMQQQGQQAQSVVDFNTARSGQIANTEQAKTGTGNAAWLMNMLQAEKSLPTPQGTVDSSLPLREMFARGQMMDSMSRLPDASRAKLPENLAQMMNMGDPRMQQMLATGTKMNASVAPGATLYDVLNQQPLLSSPRTLSEGQVLRPNVEGSQGLPKTFSPQNNNNLFGSLVNLRGQGLVSGVVSDPSNPINTEVANAISALLPQILQQATNGPRQTLPNIINGPVDRSGMKATLPNYPSAISAQDRGNMIAPLNQIVQPKSQEEFNALPSGTIYLNPADGKQYKKN